MQNNGIQTEGASTWHCATLLKLVWVADSGGQGKMMVAEGAVKVDGKLELRKRQKKLPDKRSNALVID